MQKARKVILWKLTKLVIFSTFLVIGFACSDISNEGTDFADTSNESKEAREVFTVVEEQPSFAGGMEAFYQHVMSEIRYPLSARQKQMEGRVEVQFVVEKDGSLSDVKAINGIGAECDQEAVSVLQSAPSFKPGSQRGKTVRVRMVIPIIFKLNRGKTNADNSTQGIIVVEEVELRNGKLKVDASYANGAWSGTVYSPEGDVLPGTNIVVAGASSGTVSDLDGTFKIEALESPELNISFVGYESVRLPRNSRID